MDDPSSRDERGHDPVDQLTAEVIAALKARAPDIFLTPIDLGKVRALIEERYLLRLCRARLARG